MASASDYRAHAALQPADCLILLPQRLPAAVEPSIRPAHYPAECTQSDAFLQPSLRAPKGHANSYSSFSFFNRDPRVKQTSSASGLRRIEVQLAGGTSLAKCCFFVRLRAVSSSRPSLCCTDQLGLSVLGW